VIVATGSSHTPHVPAFDRDLSKEIVRMHSSDYRNPAQLREGPVLVVGTGNSGAEVAFEVVMLHPTLLAGKTPPEIPVRHGGVPSRFVLPVVRFVGHHVLNLDTPLGRKARPRMLTGPTPLIRTKMKDLEAAGVERVSRVVGTKDGRPLLQDQRVLDVTNVIWCTGYRETYPWIKLPVFADDGTLLQNRGVATTIPGLFFVGLRFQYAATSEVLPGVGRDARYIASLVATQPD
jgi:putative flavoprotein involved in K+ transport